MLQSSALNILKIGNNVFLTGSAGSGKTYVLSSYIDYLKRHRISVAVTASTGIAATHIGGMTIHAWSGLGIRDSLDEYALDQLSQRKYLYERYRSTHVVIIDEVSMISGVFLDMFDKVCRMMRRSAAPFGGMQIVLCGDLFQLPPVTRDGAAPLITESQSFQSGEFVTCYLTEQHRQDDIPFIDVLNAIRSNDVQDYHIELLRDRIVEGEEIVDDYIHTKLYTHNADVDAINMQKLAELDGVDYRYAMSTRGSHALVDTLKRSCLAQETLVLKIGAEVLFIKNKPEAGYVNGTRGVVIDISDDGMPIVETRSGDHVTVYPEVWSVEDEGKIKASITQIPLRLAWAITIHKSQGMTLDSAIIDLSKSFGFGMGYVALSRVRTLSGIHLLGMGDRSLSIDPRVQAIDQKLREWSDSAESMILSSDDNTIASSHEAFITLCGGSLAETAVEESGSHHREPTAVTTWKLIQSGKTINEVAVIRSLTSGTIVGHIVDAHQKGLGDIPYHIRPDQNSIDAVSSARSVLGDVKLSELRAYLIRTSGVTLDYDTIRLACCCSVT